MIPVSNRAFTRKLALQKSTSLEKSKKNALMESIIQFLQKTAFEYRAQSLRNEVQLSFRISLKYKGERTEIALDILGPQNSDMPEDSFLGSRLKIGSTICFINKIGTYLLLKWIKKGEGCDFPALNGNRFESACYHSFPPLPDTFWSDWKQSKEAQYAANFFRFHIYPTCLSYIRQLLMPARACEILEICGGDGEFATSVLNELGHKISTYELMDKNQASLSIAALRFSHNAYKNKAYVLPIDVVQEAMNAKQFDLIIGIGAMTPSVLACRSDAYALLQKITPKLKIGGFILLAGFHSHWIDSKDLNRLNYSIKNMTCPDTGKPLYLAQKT